MTTITVRAIKSFEYRTVKNLVLQVDLSITGKQLLDMCVEKIKSTPGMKPFALVQYDTLKIYVKAHESKTSTLVINLDNDDRIIDLSKSLSELGIEHETELSLFNLEQYRKFQSDPKVSWE
ncbi:hypothetical protein EDD86DRAFT_226241 [Gorgonomyces haynaldii]|nr:hypothetical protein EDD86DRAFT_226241 [Gorgonomyces haynaldii]